MPAQTQSERTNYELKLGVATREAFGKALVELGRENKDVVVCDADLSKSTMTTYFAKEFPDRFFECGIAEAAATKGKPTCIIAQTVKGKGVSFMENNPKYHGVAPSQQEMELALQEIG